MQGIFLIITITVILANFLAEFLYSRLNHASAQEGANMTLASFWHSLKTTLKLIAHNKVGFLGFLGVLFFVLLSFVGPLFIPLGRGAKVDQIYAAPSLQHPLGTDSRAVTCSPTSSTAGGTSS